MLYPTLYAKESSRQMVDTFHGYNHNLRISDSEFYDMKNMTSDYYPVLSPRRKRGVYATPSKPNGLISKDSLCYVDGKNFVINEYSIDMGLTDTPKSLISMGAYVIIMPDKKYINTQNFADRGDIDAVFDNHTSMSDVTFTLCSIDGVEYSGAQSSSTEPENPHNADLWIDTSSTPYVLKKYSADSSVWVTIATTYIKISTPGIGANFNQYDGVKISGVQYDSLQDLNATMVIWSKSDDYIVVVGITDKTITQPAEYSILVERKMPNMDFIIESENRLWGCRYGDALNGEVVNEIYACKLGDFKNWNCFMNLSTDSYVASCGTDGQFTGAITHLGFPLFFKTTCVHKVYGNYPANFQIQTTTCRGVQKGCERSLAIVNEVLYYKSQSGVCAYDGSLPVEISASLGEINYGNAVAGAHGNKYYITMEDVAGQNTLFVYDTAKGMWHKEDGMTADAFCSCRGELYAISDGKIITMLGSGTQESKPVQWMSETGEIGLYTPDMKYISRLTVRMATDIGSEIRIYVSYDFCDIWEQIYMLKSKSLRSVAIPIKPKRCDYMKIRIEGIGNAKIYSIAKTIEQGSDLP